MQSAIENTVAPSLSKDAVILYDLIRYCLYNNKDFTIDEMQSYLCSTHTISHKELEQLVETIYNAGDLIKKSFNGQVYYSFFGVLDSEKKIPFPDGSFLYVKDKDQVNEWKRLIHSGIKEKFPLESHYYQPV